jgi:hypothetical protein
LKGVSAVDDLGASTIAVRQAKRLCAPVNKNGEDPTAPSHPGHLTFYTIRQTAPRFVGADHRNLTIRDQFGTLTLDLVRPERMLVPTAKSLQPPPPLTPPALPDHFKCYRVRGAGRVRETVSVQTQFEAQPITVTVKRARDLCFPVDKNNGGIIDPSRGLMCYQVRTAPHKRPHVYTTDQFGSADYDFFGIRDLCVPLIEGPGICGDGRINAPGEDCEDDNDAACPGQCDTQTCTCPAPAACGNDAVEGTEECDGTDDAACSQACKADCTCPSCGDDAVNQQSEQCDGTDNAACSGEQCKADCACPSCGDGVVNQQTEVCDGSDGPCLGHCNASCTCDPFCGDGIVQQNESCDPPGSPCLGGGTCLDCAGCATECIPPTCGPNDCGALDNLCGAPIDCGGCTDPKTCDMFNQCVCPPFVCEEGEPNFVTCTCDF